jgi:sulfur-oxidizing protein SoxX
VVNGGNCYNCHQIDKKEISYGTIGPSLYNYGKIRGVTDPKPGCGQGNRGLHLGQDLESARRTTPAPTCPAPGHMGVLS